MSLGKRNYDRGNLFDNMEASEFLEEISPDETVYFGVSSLRDYAEVLLKDIYFEEMSGVPDYVEDVYDSPSVFLGMNGAAILTDENSDGAFEVVYLDISAEEMASIGRRGFKQALERGRDFDFFDDITHSDPLETWEDVEDYVEFVEEKDLGLTDQ